ncbi:hypothetical protein QJQ45_019092 [Haematococcus lacustris]|nr:hypothetical protein QJQ45_019092 [Haematococcus lacustris]
MTRCRVEGVIGFLGYCEAVQSVEIGLVMDEDTAEEPTYDQLPVGAWLAERVMANFPNCQVLGFKPFLMRHSELVELLSHPLVVGRIRHLDIQTALLTGRERVVPFAWVEPALGLTSLHATNLGPLPISLRDRTSNLVTVSVTEMYLADVGNLPRSVLTLLIADLNVFLPEPDMAALKRGVADLSSGRFGRQEVGLLAMAITRKEGCAAIAALKPLVGRFWEALVQMGEPGHHGNLVQSDVVDAVIPIRLSKKCWEACFLNCNTFSLNITSEAITTHLSPDVLKLLRGRQKPLPVKLHIQTSLGAAIHRCRVDWVIGLLGRCEAVHTVAIMFLNQAVELEPWWKRHYEPLPVGAWLAERLMANFPNCLLLSFRGFTFSPAQLEALMRHSLIAERITHLDIYTGGLVGSLKDNWQALEDVALKLTALWAWHLGPLPHSLRHCNSNLKVLCVREMAIHQGGNLPTTISLLQIARLIAVLPERNLLSLARGVEAISTGCFEKVKIGLLTFTCKEGASQASLAPLMPLVGQFEEAFVEALNDTKQRLQEVEDEHAREKQDWQQQQQDWQQQHQDLQHRQQDWQQQHQDWQQRQQDWQQQQQLLEKQLHDLLQQADIHAHIIVVSAANELARLKHLGCADVHMGEKAAESRSGEHTDSLVKANAQPMDCEAMEAGEARHHAVSQPRPQLQLQPPDSFQLHAMDGCASPNLVQHIPQHACDEARRFSRCSKDTLTACLATCKTLVLYIDAYSGFLRRSAAEAFRTRAELVVLVLKRRGLWPKSDFSERLDEMMKHLGTYPAVHTVHLKGDLDVLRNTDLESWQDLLPTNLPNYAALKVSVDLINI